MALRRWLAAAALAGAFLAALPDAGAGRGFQYRRNLRTIPGATGPATRGGFVAWFRTRTDGSTVQGIRVWALGLDDATGATVWFSKPDDAETTEVAAMATAADGSASWEVEVDSARETNPSLPLDVESVLKLYFGFVEVRLAGETLALRGQVRKFSFEDLDLEPRGRSAVLRLPPDDLPRVDGLADGRIRSWRRKRGGVAAEGFVLVAAGLTEDEDYEVHLEDGNGILRQVGELTSTADGLGRYSYDTSVDGPFDPDDFGISSVRDLRGRRIEIRRSGFDDYSLAGLFPR